MWKKQKNKKFIILGFFSNKNLNCEYFINELNFKLGCLSIYHKNTTTIYSSGGTPCKLKRFKHLLTSIKNNKKIEDREKVDKILPIIDKYINDFGDYGYIDYSFNDFDKPLNKIGICNLRISMEVPMNKYFKEINVSENKFITINMENDKILIKEFTENIINTVNENKKAGYKIGKKEIKYHLIGEVFKISCFGILLYIPYRLIKYLIYKVKS